MILGSNGTVRPARMGDVREIVEIVNIYASKGLMLHRSLSQVYEGLREYEVAEEDGQIIGCGALNITWEDLGEIRSVAVREGYQGKGIGRWVVEALLTDARQLDLKRVFVLTYQPKFFAKFGFKEIEKDTLPHKVWRDCINCVKFPDCDEIAMILDIQHIKTT